MKKLLFLIMKAVGLFPSPKKLAAQLRQPHGKLGLKVGEKMNESNVALYDFVLGQMQIKPGDSLLEIGYGNGKFFSKINGLAENLSLTGIDFSETMYNEAVKNNPALISQGKLRIEFGSSDAMPFDDNSFDKVYCTNVLYFWENPEAHLNEIYRVLKPGGTFYAGIRAKESMAHVAFTQYGFAMRTDEEWKSLVSASKLSFVSMPELREPDIKFDGKLLPISSLCIIAAKAI